MIFTLTHFGKFGYDSVYEMPVQYRTFYIKKLNNIREKEREAQERAQGKQDAPSTTPVARGPSVQRG